MVLYSIRRWDPHPSLLKMPKSMMRAQTLSPQSVYWEDRRSNETKLNADRFFYFHRPEFASNKIRIRNVQQYKYITETTRQIRTTVQTPAASFAKLKSDFQIDAWHWEAIRWLISQDLPQDGFPHVARERTLLVQSVLGKSCWIGKLLNRWKFHHRISDVNI